MTTIGNYQTIINKAVQTFVGADAEVMFISNSSRACKEGGVKALAHFIDEALGEYNFYTAINHCFCPLIEAIRKKYLYMNNGRPKLMEEEAILEWIYYHHPELEDGMSFEEVQKKREEYLASDKLYHFYKVDTIETNVHRRMTRGRNTPSRFLTKNVRNLHKSKHGHLQAEEETTRRHLYNSYLALLKLWEVGLVPVLSVAAGKPLELGVSGSERG